MAGNDTPDVWPMPQFSFRVTIDGCTAGFQDVSGLDAETAPAEYCAGSAPVFSTVKMPGLARSSNVTLKKGIFARGDRILDWFRDINLNTIARKPVTISLVDETGTPTMTWTLRNAFPTKITGTDLKADGNEVAIETLELAHEGLEISNG